MNRDRSSDVMRWVFVALGMGIGAGVSEAVVRFLDLTRNVAEIEGGALEQLALAVSANVALLGLLAIVIFAVAWVSASALAGLAPRLRRIHPRVQAGGALGLTLLLLCLGTDFLGLGSDVAVAAPVCALSGGLLAGGMAVRPKSSAQRSSRWVLAVAAGLTWLASIIGSGAAVARTSRQVSSWARSGTRAAESAIEPLPNIVVIVIDTLRADRVGVYGRGNLTPNLDRLAESSIVYTQAYSTAPWTLPSHASLFTGLYPSQHDVNWGHYKLASEFETLAEILSTSGYETIGLSNNPLVGPENGLAQGFDAFLEISRGSDLGSWSLALRCRTIATFARWTGLPTTAAEDAGAGWTNWLLEKRLQRRARSHRPLFVFVNYFEVHDPYLPPAAFRRTRLSAAQEESYDTFVQDRGDLMARACGLTDTFSGSEVELMAALYDAEVFYQDLALGQLLAILQNAGVWENSWIVVTSDHGELFGESGLVFHTAGMHHALLHIPLLVRPPGGVAKRFVAAPVQPVDVFASMVEAGGGAVPSVACGAHRLPLTETDAPRRTVCIAETYGASPISLAFSQLRSLQTDYTRWMTWLTAVVADGVLLELDNDGPRALYDVTGAATGDRNLIKKRAGLVDELMHTYERWYKRVVLGEDI